MIRFSVIWLCGLLAGCGEQGYVVPDAPRPRPLDAGPSPADAGPPPPDAPEIPADDPCAYLPSPYPYELSMPNYPIRFHAGQGLEASPDLRQGGLLELLNADLSSRDVIEKRRGAVQLGDSRSTLPGDDVPDADRRAIWARGDEVLLQTHDAIYQERRAAPLFQWSRVASWIQMRLREFYANTFPGEIASADSAILGDAAVIVYQQVGGAGEAAIYGPTMAREVLLSFGGSDRPRLSHEGDRLMVSYMDAARALQAGTLASGGASVTFNPVGITLALGRTFWDVHSAQLDTGVRVTAWTGTTGAATQVVVVNWDTGAGTATYNAAVPTIIGVPVIDDVTISVWPLERSTGIRVATASVFLDPGGAPDHYVFVQVDDINITTGAVTNVYTQYVMLTAPTDFARGVAVSWEDVLTVWLAVEQDSGATRKVSYYTTGGGVPSLEIAHEATALATQGAIMAGTPTDTVSPADPLSPGFVEQLLTLAATPTAEQLGARSGWIVFAPRTGEIVARSFVGYTGDLSTRSTRPPKGSLIANGDLITWAGPAAVQSDPSTTLRAVAVCKLDRTARANKPAELDKTAISAHAGYARAYDGTSAFEHAWHTLPRITGLATGGAGATTAGEHRVAVTWEADDANGLRYESAPGIAAASITSAGTGIQVTFESLTHTERPNARAVVWMTVVGGATYYRAAEAAINAAASTQTINVSILDGTLATRPTLRQAPVPSGQGILPSLPDRVTDFVALLIDRLASRDPRVGSLMTFTIPSQEATGYAAHWAGGVVQEPLERDVTSAIEMDGRIVIGSELGLAQLVQDGPSATGQGDFGLPLVLRTPVGIEDHATTERTPLGYVFGSSEGPRLLSPGLAVTHLDEAVERHYAIDGGHMVAAAWDALREEIMLLDDTIETLRLNPHNARWAEDSNRTGRDLTVRGDGVLYLLRDDGKVLRQDPDTFSDGADDYVLRVTTPWVREPARDQLAHGGYLFNGVEVYGEHLGSHDLKVTVYLDFRDTPVIFEGTIPAATIDANAVAGRDYRYVLYTEARHCYACKVVVETSAEPNATARIAGIDVRWNPDNSPNPAQVAEEQRFPLDVSSYG